MNAVYNVVDAIRTHLESRTLYINTIKYGDIDEVDLNKTTIFPLAHFFLQSSTFNKRTITFRLNLMFLDVVDSTRRPIKVDGVYDEDVTDKFYEENLHEILNELYKEVNLLLTELTDYRGELAEQQYVLLGEPTAEMLYEEFENKLAGWGLTLDIQVPNDVKLC